MVRSIVRLVAGLLAAGAILWLLIGGRILVRNAPERSDAIVVLDGENNVRVRRAMDLLHAGYAQHVFLDVTDATIFGQAKPDIARRFIEGLPPADRARVHVCVVHATSTKEEAHAVAPCLQPLNARKILITTSDEHSLRALLTFRHELPQYEYSVAAANDPQTYGIPWWRHRQWAKFFLDESLKLFWFEAVDRWR